MQGRGGGGLKRLETDMIKTKLCKKPLPPITTHYTTHPRTTTVLLLSRTKRARGVAALPRGADTHQNSWSLSIYIEVWSTEIPHPCRTLSPPEGGYELPI